MLDADSRFNFRNRKAETMNQPHQSNKSTKQEPTDYVTYGIEGASSDNNQVSNSEPTSLLSHVAESEVKQKVIIPDPSVTPIKTEANAYSEDVEVKLELVKEGDTYEAIKMKLESIVTDEISLHNEMDILSNETVPTEFFKCQLCRYSCAYKRTNKIEKHIKMHMNKCYECEFEAENKRKLNEHILNIHVMTKTPYKCTLCKFRAPLKSILAKHSKTHTAKKFKCKLCNFKTDRYKLLLREHMKKHKIFKCNVCEYKTLKRRNYKRHMKKHKPMN